MPCRPNGFGIDIGLRDEGSTAVMGEGLSSAVILLAVYCGMILLASLAGGWIPLWVRLTHTRLQVATSFVAGLMLGVGLLHLLPHAWLEFQSIEQTSWWLLFGFLVMFFIQRFFHFHHHDVPDEAPEGHWNHGQTAAHEHEEEDHFHEFTLAGKSARQLSWGGAVFGLTLHSLIDGFALAAIVEADHRSGGSGWFLGLGTFLVILLHKPFDAMAIGTLMAAGGMSKGTRHWVNSLFALVIPVGVLMFQLGASQYSEAGHLFLGGALAFATGTFLCIAASDLLPELQFHSHDRVKLSVALLVGLGLAALVGNFKGHEHDHSTPHSHSEHTESLTTPD